MKSLIGALLTTFLLASVGCGSTEKLAEKKAQQQAEQKAYQKQAADKAHQELDRETAK